jgi:hypothetical protein
MTDYAYVLADNATVPNAVDLGFDSGLVAIDAVGDLTPEVVPIDLDNGIYLLSKSGATLAQYKAAAGAFADRLGYVGRSHTAVYPAATVIPAVAPTPSALPDGSWTPAE